MNISHEDISVLIPCYNQADFLAEALDSVLAQTFMPAKIIVVNDGSTDASGEIATRYAKEHASITYIEQENAGVCAACATGLAAISTPYFVRLDADDRMPADYIEQLAATLANHPEADFAYCDAEYFGALTGRMSARTWSVAALIPENYIHVSSLIKTADARAVGYYSESMKGGFEDWDFYLSLVDAGKRGVYCRSTFLWYRIHTGGGRNRMSPERARALRAQIQKNHPKLYSSIYHRLILLQWRVVRRLRHVARVS